MKSILLLLLFLAAAGCQRQKTPAMAMASEIVKDAIDAHEAQNELERRAIALEKRLLTQCFADIMCLKREYQEWIIKECKRSPAKEMYKYRGGIRACMSEGLRQSIEMPAGSFCPKPQYPPRKPPDFPAPGELPPACAGARPLMRNSFSWNLLTCPYPHSHGDKHKNNHKNQGE